MPKQFDLNKKISDAAIASFNNIKDKIDYMDMMNILRALSKLKMYEEEGLQLKPNYEFINHPEHYQKQSRKECIDEMIELFGISETALWCNMTAYKYQYRMGSKPNNTTEQDSQKADWYLRKAKELQGYDER